MKELLITAFHREKILSFLPRDSSPLYIQYNPISTHWHKGYQLQQKAQISTDLFSVPRQLCAGIFNQGRAHCAGTVSALRRFAQDQLSDTRSTCRATGFLKDRFMRTMAQQATAEK